MTNTSLHVFATFLIFSATSIWATQAHVENNSYLHWPAKRAEQIVRAARVNGRVGGAFDFRLLNTDRSYNYKLRATWLTDDVIRATARLIQVTERLTEGQTAALVREALQILGTVVLIEIDPREGSGVIPLEWTATLQPHGASEPGTISRGVNRSDLRTVRALSGGFRRDYNYEVFWMEFLPEPPDGPRFPSGATQTELVVRIHDKEGRFTWPIIPASGSN
jgi:hypothetical protein